MISNYMCFNTWNLDSNGVNFAKFVNRVIKHKATKIIIWHQYEWEWHCYQRIKGNSLARLQEYCKQNSCKVELITGGAYKNYPNEKVDIDFSSIVNLSYWDTFWLGRTYQCLHRHHRIENNNPVKVIDPFQDVNYRYHFISMNGRAHWHRAEFLDYLAKYDLINGNAISAIENRFSEYNYRYLKNFTPMYLSDNYKETYEQHMLPIEYNFAFAQICCESSIDTIFCSEKTATPLIMGKPFIVVGQMHFHEWLKNLGFQLYDELFDYSFDNEPDYRKRYDMIMLNFKKIQNIPLSELNSLRKKLAEKIKFNKFKVREIIRDPLKVPQLANEILNYYKRTGHDLDHGTTSSMIELENALDTNF